jgi:hypothetical protein
MDFEVSVESGPEAMHEALNDRSEAYDQLVTLAAKMRERVPELTPAQAFERTLQDPVNVELARRALNRPVPPGVGGYPFPVQSSPGRQ